MKDKTNNKTNNKKKWNKTVVNQTIENYFG